MDETGRFSIRGVMLMVSIPSLTFLATLARAGVMWIIGLKAKAIRPLAVPPETRLPQWARLRFLLCGLAALGSGCSGASPAGGGGVISDQTPVPEAVQSQVTAHVPADGQVHAQASSNFQIDPETVFCELPSEIDKSLRASGATGVGLMGVGDLLQSIGQNAYQNGVIRTQMISDPGCRDGKNIILHKGYALPGIHGKPFRIVIAVWQGNAHWVGQIEKEIDPGDPKTWGKLPPFMGNPHINLVIRPAIEQVSLAFVNHVRARGEKLP